MFLSVILLIASCSKSPTTLTIVCQSTSSKFDEAYSFNFDTGDIQVSRSLNAYGYEQKRLAYERLDSNLAPEDMYETLDSLFLEKDSKMVIRKSTDGFITFGYSKDANDAYDLEHTLNRASLQMKVVTKLDKSFIPADFDMKPETTTFMDCKKPNV